MNKITISDYPLTKEEAKAYIAFMLWMARHPDGGLFKYGKFEFYITKL